MLGSDVLVRPDNVSMQCEEMAWDAVALEEAVVETGLPDMAVVVVCVSQRSLEEALEEGGWLMVLVTKAESRGTYGLYVYGTAGCPVSSWVSLRWVSSS